MSYAPIDTQKRNALGTSADTLFSKSISISPQKADPSVNPRRKASDAKANSRKVARSSDKSGSTTDYPIIVHCHLCWDWVWQRPQQFISRLSQRHRVLFVEMHPPDDNLVTPTARLRKVEAYPNLTILQMQFPGRRWNEGEFVDERRLALLKEALCGPLRGQFDQPVQWFYDPMAVTAFAGEMGEVCTVYDCMDELSKFRGAPSSILEREATLLKMADVVFAGGRKLCEAKSRHNDNCHFYGCGVDVDHFGKALRNETEIPEDVRQLRKPMLGFFGVVDERMDYELLAKMAQAKPDWSIVIIGPMTKVDESSIPRAANLHWMGGRDYAQLPNYCKAFDVCLMPFALNEATEYINPTKALEYMAAGREIVSTAVPDVVRNFGDIVKIARSHDEFISQCEQAISQGNKESISRGIDMARANSWESIVAKLEQHVNEATKTARAGIA